MLRRLIAALTLASLTTAAAWSESPARITGIILGDMWVAASHGGSKATAGYVTLYNHSREDERLMSASCTCSAQVEIHQMWMDGQIMRMRRVDDGLPIPAGGKLVLAKGGAHLMILDLKTPLKAGEKARITLVLQHNGNIILDYPVRDSAPMPMSGMKH